MNNPKTGRTLTQDNWKRSQIRLPKPLYDDVFEYAQKHSISLNQAVIELLDKGLLGNEKHTEEVEDLKEVCRLLTRRMCQLERLLQKLTAEE